MNALVVATTLILRILVTIDVTETYIGVGGEPGESCTVNGREDLQNTKIHLNKNGDNRCCVTRQCHAGTQARLCDVDDPRTTACLDCSAGKFQANKTISYNMIPCERHTVCSRGGSFTKEPGTPTNNAICICDLANGYHGIWPACFNDITCRPGTQLTVNGDCEPCRPGFYQISESSKPCQPCPTCGAPMSKEIAHICSNSVAVGAPCETKLDDVGPSKGNGERNDNMIIIGAVIGVVSLLAVVVIAGVCVMMHKRRQSRNSSMATIPGSDTEKGPEGEALMHQKAAAGQPREAEYLITLNPQGSNDDCSLCYRNNIDRSGPPTTSSNNSPVSGMLALRPDQSSESTKSISLDGIPSSDSDQKPSYDLRPDAVPGSESDTESVGQREPNICMQGHNNVQGGNIYVFNHCSDVTVRR